MSEKPVRSRLKCVECGRQQADGKRGWRAYLTTDEEEPAEAVVYCPDCAAHEFAAAPKM
jgi:ribosomal protein L44E